MFAPFNPLLLLCFLTQGLATPGEGIRFHGLTTEDGLSDGTIYSILQDRMGFLWFATRNGLNRFNGIDFDYFYHDSENPATLSSNYVYGLAEDLDGNLWIGSQGGGLDRYDPVNHRITRQADFGGPAMGSTVGGVVLDEKGRVWAVTKRQGLFYRELDGTYHNLVHDPDDPKTLSHNETWYAMPDGRGNLWVLMGEYGFNRVNSRSGEVARHRAMFPTDEHLPYDEIWAVAKTKDGHMLAGFSGDGLWRIDPATNQTKQLLTARQFDENIKITALMEDRDGVIWIGTLGSGLLLLAPGAKEALQYRKDPVDRYSLGMDKFRSMYQDRAGTVWLGTYGSGLNHVSANGLVFQHYRASMRKSGLQSPLVHAVTAGQNQVWVGTENGLTRYFPDGRSRVYQHVPGVAGSLSHSTVTALTLDREQRLWAGTMAGGLNLWNEQKDTFRAYRADEQRPNSLTHDRVSAIAEDGQGRLWVGTFLGLNRLLDPLDGRFQHYRADGTRPETLQEDFVTSLAFDTSDTLWVGTWDGGLSQYHEQTNRFQHYTRESGLPNDTIWDLHAAPNHILWVGTNTGLVKLHTVDANPETAQMQVWEVKDGLPGGAVYAVQADKNGLIWLGTNRGLARLNPNNGHLRIFTPRDGIQDWVFSSGACALDEQGRLYFGGKKGFNRFSPDLLGQQSRPPRTVLTRLLVANKEINPHWDRPKGHLKKALTHTDTLTFSYTERMFSLEMAALDYVAPDQNRYRYILEGFNEDWIEVGADYRRVTYTNLDPGTYTFRAGAATLDGDWNSDEATVVITIKTPPWRTWWAIALYIIMPFALFLVYSVSLERKVRSRTDALLGTRRKLMEAAKMAGMAEIATDVLHNVGNIINSVKISVHVVREVISGDQWKDFFQRVLGLLRKHEEELGGILGRPERGRQLILGLERILTDVSRRFEQVTEESDKLEDHLQNIVAILREQQEYTMTRGWALEKVDLSDIIEHALDMEAYLFREKTVTLVKDLQAVPPVHLERTRFNRVIIFLLSNAIEAIEAKGEPGTIQLAVRCEDQMVEVSLADDGIGIDPEQIGQIFVHGFTSKKHHKGFGLHFCANAMKEMGGSIAVDSPGEGQGATARLLFPIVEEKDQPSLRGILRPGGRS